MTFRTVGTLFADFRALFAAALLGAFIATPRAAVLDAQPSLSPTQAMTGETIQLVVRVSADKKEDLPWPRVEGLGAFTVTKSTNVSSGSQTSVVNGTITHSEYFITEFVFNLVTQRPGDYVVGPIRYAHKDFQRDLGSATVSVTKGDAGIIARPTLGKSRVYVGEQTLYTLRIIPKEGVQSVNWPQDMQKYIGQKFFFQPIDSTMAPKVVTLDGRETQVLDFRIALFPLLAGSSTLEGMPVEYRQVRRAARGGSAADMFEEFFGGGGRVVTQTVQSPSLRLEAVPLPAKAPEDFNGSVGKYAITAKLDRDEAATGDAVSLTVTIRGNGQPKSVLQPKLPDLSRFEVYDPEKTSASTVEGGTLWTTHTFKYILLPNREGDYDLSGISYAYFDPARGAYARATAPALKLRVVRGKGGAGGGYAAQREIQELGSDIRFLKTQGPALRNDSDLPYHHAGFVLLLALPPLALVGALFARRRRDRLRADSALLRRSQASKKLRARLKTARAALDAGNPREFYRALSEAMAAFASDRLNREFRGLTQAEARAALSERGASPATADAWDALLQRCDFMLFAGAAAAPEETRRDLEAGEKLLASLDKELA